MASPGFATGQDGCASNPDLHASECPVFGYAGDGGALDRRPDAAEGRVSGVRVRGSSTGECAVGISPYLSLGSHGGSMRLRKAWQRWLQLWVREGSFFVLVILVALIVFIVAVTLSRFTAVDAAAWLEAVSTFAAFIAAGIAVSYAYRTWTVEDQRERDRLERDAQSQASLVAAWPEGRFTRRLTDTKWILDRTGTIWVRNASQVPIYNLVVEYGALWSQNVDGQVVERTSYLGQKSIIMMPPTEQPVQHDPNHILWSQLELVCAQGPVQHPDVRIRLNFDDAQGQRWTRHEDGRLGRFNPDRGTFMYEEHEEAVIVGPGN